MSIAPTLQRHLTAENIQYDVIPHDPTMSSADRLAKAIVLRRNAGLYARRLASVASPSPFGFEGPAWR
jgi:hypothetical protein